VSMAENKRVKLGDVANLSGGYAFKSSQYTKVGRFVLRTVNIRDDASITKEGATFISECEASQFERFALREHDTLFVMVAATLGKIGYVRATDLPALLNQNMWVIRAKEGLIDPIYLHYLFRELSKVPLAWVSGSARSFLRRDDVRNLEFSLPARSAQIAISALLKALDDKIELNRRMNETLESMARALFKDWFVDFGPTRAKMEGREAYLAPDLWSLFPNRLDDNGVPEGWRTYRVDEIADHHTKSLKPIDAATEVFEHFSLPAYDSGQQPVLEVGGGIKSNKTIVPNGAILLSKLNPEIPRVWWPQDKGVHRQIASTEFLAFTAKAGISPALLYSLFSDQTFRQRLEGMVTGTSKSHQRISPPALRSLEVLVGDEKVFAAFDEIATSLMQKVLANRAENLTLAQTRDLLLPKLMSGEISLRDAEKQVEAVA
jgi:type I restriction enzyme, S subunit